MRCRRACSKRHLFVNGHILRSNSSEIKRGGAVCLFGNGINDMERIDLMKPDIVKLDRELISGIDHDLEKSIT